jgi:hypothetical protein
LVLKAEGTEAWSEAWSEVPEGTEANLSYDPKRSEAHASSSVQALNVRPLKAIGSEDAP